MVELGLGHQKEMLWDLLFGGGGGGAGYIKLPFRRPSVVPPSSLAHELTFAAGDWARMLGLRAFLVLVLAALRRLLRHPVWEGGGRRMGW